MKLLNNIQQKLHAPKGQENKFGGYKYRSCEDIVEAVKPLLGDGTLRLVDEIVEVGGRVYVKATAILWDGDNVADATAFAREPLSRKGMDESQITGAASSYARKYALNGLFCIDDTKDADTKDNTKLLTHKGLEACTNLTMLGTVWNELNHKDKETYLPLKNELKTRLSEAQ